MPLTSIYCHHWKPRKMNIFNILAMVSGRSSIISFKVRFLLKLFEMELIKTKKATIIVYY
jgi:hypothetical protein